MWDYGSLNHEQEAAYVQSKMMMVNKDFDMYVQIWNCIQYTYLCVIFS